MGSDGFDTRSPGTEEGEWHALLEGSGRLGALAGPLLIVSPHPDDETLAAGGLLYQHPRSAVLLVTEGEAAGSATLPQIRRMEMGAALRILSGARVERLGIPDSHVAQHEFELERALERRMRHFATIVAPFEEDGHTDHDAVGRVCQMAARRHRKPLLRYLVWKWHHGRPTEFRTRQFVRFSLNEPAQTAKRRAIACYESQTGGGNYAVVPSHVLTYFLRPYEAFLR